MSTHSLEHNQGNTLTTEQRQQIEERLAYFENKLADPLTGIVEGPSLLKNLSQLILLSAVPWEEGVQLFRQGHQNLMNESTLQPDPHMSSEDEHAEIAAQTRRQVASVIRFLPRRTNIVSPDEPKTRIQLTQESLKEARVILEESGHNRYSDNVFHTMEGVYDIDPRTKLVFDILDQPYTILDQD